MKISLQKKAPIAFFAYNRPNHTAQSLSSLSRCEGASESELFIFCDGAKKEEDRLNVEEVRRVVRGHRWCGTVNIIERDENKGLANSIISGVTELCERYGRVIVIEDDLLLSPHFLNYMNGALEFYKDIHGVMHISGYMFPVKGTLPETFFYRAASCWGWGTWKRAWDMLETDSEYLLDCFKEKKIIYEFDIKDSYDFYKMLLKQSSGEIDSWAIRWYASVFLAGGLCLHPGKSLVKNIGHDHTGTHCRATDVFNVSLSNTKVTHFAEKVIEDEAAVRSITEFFSSMKGEPIYMQFLKKFKCRVTDFLKI